jgi:hypothetical protein
MAYMLLCSMPRQEAEEIAMRTITADRALPHSHGDEIAHRVAQIGVRLRDAGAAWVAHRKASRLPDVEPQPRNRVQADIGAFVSVAMRLD